MVETDAFEMDDQQESDRAAGSRPLSSAIAAVSARPDDTPAGRPERA